MELKKGELRVFYGGRGSADLDLAIGKALEPFGYTFKGSGLHFADDVRDLAFEREGEGDETGRDE